ncbi:MAG TPA: type II toxin-antitoxin system RelE/ParE family toxin [Stellaceae bacterium]|nr:type II toxin-antitoxin system RelE/ParE family toxin [Stellaceae bacterium]
MPRLRYTRAARDSLTDIARYLRRRSGSAAVARRFVDQLRGRCAELAASPFQLGRPRPELRPDLRSFAMGNYLIFFRYVGDVLEIVDIVEGHRDIDGYFRGG